jgi:hypothetical protein
MRVKVIGVETSSFNDFYALILPRPGEVGEPLQLYFFQNSMPSVGDEWAFGPLRFQQKVDFKIFSRYLFERTQYEPNRPGKLDEIGIDHWQIHFEDYCDHDWDDLIVDITLAPPNPSLAIMRPANNMSFITDTEVSYQVKAQGYAWDMSGNNISHEIDWYVFPFDNSGVCNPSYIINSRYFNFVASIPPRGIREEGPLGFNIRAVVNPNITPISVTNQIKQDNIDTLRQQYVDFSIKIPFKSRIDIGAEPTVIPTAEILFEVFDMAENFYREWCNNPDARFVITSQYRSPVHNQNEGGHPHSLHQYGFAIDIGYDNCNRPGQRDDSKAVYQYIIGLGIENIYPLEHPELNYNHVHVSNFTYGSMPYVER